MRTRFILAAMLLVAATSTAFAADANIPYGEYITDLLAWFRDIAVIVIVWLIKSYGPPMARQYITTLMVGKAVDYAIGVVDGAIKGKVWTVDITNQVLAEAEAFLQDHYSLITKWVGDRLRPLILSQLSAIGAVPAEATKQSLDLAPVAVKPVAVARMPGLALLIVACAGLLMLLSGTGVEAKTAVLSGQQSVLNIFPQIQKQLQDVVTFFENWTEDDLNSAATLSMSIEGLQDPTGQACWQTYKNLGLLIKAHPLPLTLKGATDIEALRLFEKSVKQACAKMECTQLWSDLTNMANAANGQPLSIPSFSTICARVP